MKTILVDGKYKAILRTTTGHVEEYDHVIMACHSGASLKILENGGTLTPEERSILGGFKWTWNPTVLHSDVAVRALSLSSPDCTNNGWAGTSKAQESVVFVELCYALRAADKRSTSPSQHGSIRLVCTSLLEPLSNHPSDRRLRLYITGAVSSIAI